MLEQHADAAAPRVCQRCRERAVLDDVLAEIDCAEQAGIARKDAVRPRPSSSTSPTNFRSSAHPASLFFEVRRCACMARFSPLRREMSGRTEGGAVPHTSPVVGRYFRKDPDARKPSAHQAQRLAAADPISIVSVRPISAGDAELGGDLQPGRAAEDEAADNADGKAHRRLAPPVRQHDRRARSPNPATAPAPLAAQARRHSRQFSHEFDFLRKEGNNDVGEQPKARAQFLPTAYCLLPAAYSRTPPLAASRRR